VDRRGNNHLIEIAGVLSGFGGFEQVYRDDRVLMQVCDMLEQKYGNITINDGTDAKNEYKKEHPFLYHIYSLFGRFIFGKPKVLSSKKAHTDWMAENVKNIPKQIFPFPIYEGQESTVLNIYNEPLNMLLVNPYVSEEIARNKLFQYLLLRNSDLGLPSSIPLGLGITNEEELERMFESSERFVIKPILGSGGRGVDVITKKQAQDFRNTRGPTDYLRFMDIRRARNGEVPLVKYIEDLVDEEDFSFESGLSIIQPFVNSKIKVMNREVYSIVRAVVCNGEFVDAYLTISDTEVANLSQGGKVVPFEGEIGDFCEGVVKTFEKRGARLSPNHFKKRLYQELIQSRGRTSKAQRINDALRRFDFGVTQSL
jgi:hypothetical protein